ncbi:MAG: Head fiber protein [Anaerolineae bacterium]|nr:Head fiber protein [Anaerolineae bacterium]
MSYNAGNYMEQGGDKLVIGGELQIASGGMITNAGTQASAIDDIALTYTSNDPSITPNGAVTIADGGTPTVDELLEYCEELQANQNAILAVLRGAGLIPSS